MQIYSIENKDEYLKDELIKRSFSTRNEKEINLLKVKKMNSETDLSKASIKLLEKNKINEIYFWYLKDKGLLKIDRNIILFLKE